MKYFDKISDPLKSRLLWIATPLSALHVLSITSIKAKYAYLAITIFGLIPLIVTIFLKGKNRTYFLSVLIVILLAVPLLMPGSDGYYFIALFMAPPALLYGVGLGGFVEESKLWIPILIYGLVFVSFVAFLGRISSKIRTICFVLFVISFSLSFKGCSQLFNETADFSGLDPNVVEDSSE
ncbi:MAG: hypothetical protein QF741_04470 [Candidatus Peribacteraceae bacterium]|jgi:hypothetical protein|nr:hypothetical protein [Candidatus Peribacteraceae bacterium]MDP7454347.1 hypothetical protein [Candidatus Peribacteraceae bacterium]